MEEPHNLKSNEMAECCYLKSNEMAECCYQLQQPLVCDSFKIKVFHMGFSASTRTLQLRLQQQSTLVTMVNGILVAPRPAEMTWSSAKLGLSEI